METSLFPPPPPPGGRQGGSQPISPGGRQVAQAGRKEKACRQKQVKGAGKVLSSSQSGKGEVVGKLWFHGKQCSCLQVRGESSRGKVKGMACR